MLHLRRCFLLILCAQDISTDVSIVMHEKKKTESSLYTCIQSTLLLGMYGADRRDRRVSLFGGLCSQTASPLLLCIRMAKADCPTHHTYRSGILISLRILPLAPPTNYSTRMRIQVAAAPDYRQRLHYGS